MPTIEGIGRGGTVALKNYADVLTQGAAELQSGLAGALLVVIGVNFNLAPAEHTTTGVEIIVGGKFQLPQGIAAN